MKNLHSNSDKRGSEIVDPTAHSTIRKLPKQTRKGAQLFVDGVVKKMPRRPKPDEEADFDGASDKLIYRVASPHKHGDDKPNKKQTFMVKPYYEDMGGWDWVQYPLAGWAEMTTQGLYHAGGIGHLCQKVSTFLDHKNNNSPLLAIQLEEGRVPVGDLNTSEPDSEMRTDLVKIGLMDFLTNHQDRHPYNMMASMDDTYGTSKHPLAIDNGRAFGYNKANRFAADYDADKDFLWHYLYSPAHEAVFIDSKEDKHSAEDIRKMFKWWKKSRKNIAKEFDQHLKSILDPHVKQWLKKNFDLRVKMLNKMAASKDLTHPYHSKWGVSLLLNKHGEEFGGDVLDFD